MSTQSAASHAHHPVPTYIATVFWVVAAVALVRMTFFEADMTRPFQWAMLLGLLMVIAIGRGYTVKLQDRIIMLEMKVRCAELLPAGDDAKLAKLSPKQIVALRFASDAELGELLDRAVREGMEPKAIKAAIRTWKPDYNRT